MVNKAYTQEQWVAMFKTLPDSTKWKILQDMNPVPKEIKAESGISVRLVIEGVRQPKELEGEVVEPLAIQGEVES